MGKELDVEKLTGHDNYHTWAFAIKNVIAYKKGYNDCLRTVDKTENGIVTKVCAEKDATKIESCRALIALCVEKNVFTHLMGCKTAIDTWNKLSNLYETSGISRKIAILRNMLSCKLEDIGGMQPYVDEIISGANKLKGIGFNMTDEWVGAILLAGLTENFIPLIMAIEATTNEIKSDLIIAKLLDAQQHQPSSGNGSSFFSKKNFFSKGGKNPKKNQQCKNCGRINHQTRDCRDDKKCFACGKTGHIKKDCRSSKKENANTAFHAMSCQAD